METTKGAGGRNARWWKCIIPILLFVACSRENAPDPKLSTQAATNENTEAFQQWRANRELARAKAEAEATQPKPANSNLIDSAKALESLSGFSDRLKAIVGDSLQNAKDIRAKAEAGDAAAQFDLAVIYAQQGDYAAAVQWYLKAAEQGDSRAEHALGVLYIFGQSGTVDYAEAIKWFTRAAEKGDVDSQYSLGVRYAKGDHVEKDFSQAVRWFSMAANQGQPDAQVSLSRRYAAGEGVQKDVVEAYKWVLVAGDYWSAKGVRDQLEPTMTAEQIKEGERRAEAFKPVKTSRPH